MQLLRLKLTERYACPQIKETYERNYALANAMHLCWVGRIDAASECLPTFVLPAVKVFSLQASAYVYGHISQ
ncbi:MAG: hypothetical protein CVU29_07415 [Betaproteobacteria bacterium HGW-Betaproteobacteria-22]|nr:MAG: hypothetical protein CVU29_07415 [Betaproteobacteria bacterium HGW-Betaproteobacteria-22]